MLKSAGSPARRSSMPRRRADLLIWFPCAPSLKWRIGLTVKMNSYLNSIHKQDDKWIFEIRKYADAEETGDKEYKFGILLDDYVKIQTVDDIIIKYGG